MSEIIKSYNDVQRRNVDMGDGTFAERVAVSTGTGTGNRLLVEPLGIPSVARQLSTANRQRLEGYLAWKWALEANLPAGHPFKNTPPTV